MEKNQKSKLVVVGLEEYLKETKQENLLPEVTDILEKELRRSTEDDKIVVNSSVALEKKQMNQIRNIVKKVLKKDIPLISKIDKTLIGGFTIRVGDWFVDASLKSQLSNLRLSMMA